MKKEVKVVVKVLERGERVCGKVKEGLKDLSERVERLKEKTGRQVEGSAEWAEALERKEEPPYYSGFSHLQMVGFSAPALFSNFLYMSTGKFGLFMKREVEEPWFPFSDLNFLERRVLFLGVPLS